MSIIESQASTMTEHYKTESQQKGTAQLAIPSLRSSNELEDVDILSPNDTEDTIIDD